jgi:hypothetical protein
VGGAVFLEPFFEVTFHAFLVMFGQSGKASAITKGSQLGILFGIRFTGLAIPQMEPKLYNVPKACLLVLGFVTDV